jgi:hypothetical protein
MSGRPATHRQPLARGRGGKHRGEVVEPTISTFVLLDHRGINCAAVHFAAHRHSATLPIRDAQRGLPPPELRTRPGPDL